MHSPLNKSGIPPKVHRPETMRDLKSDLQNENFYEDLLSPQSKISLHAKASSSSSKLPKTPSSKNRQTASESGTMSKKNCTTQSIRQKTAMYDVQKTKLYASMTPKLNSSGNLLPGRPKTAPISSSDDGVSNSGKGSNTGYYDFVANSGLNLSTQNGVEARFDSKGHSGKLVYSDVSSANYGDVGLARRNSNPNQSKASASSKASVSRGYRGYVKASSPSAGHQEPMKASGKCERGYPNHEGAHTLDDYIGDFASDPGYKQKAKPSDSSSDFHSANSAVVSSAMPLESAMPNKLKHKLKPAIQHKIHNVVFNEENPKETAADSMYDDDGEDELEKNPSDSLIGNLLMGDEPVKTKPMAPAKPTSPTKPITPLRMKVASPVSGKPICPVKPSPSISKNQVPNIDPFSCTSDVQSESDAINMVKLSECDGLAKVPEHLGNCDSPGASPEDNTTFDTSKTTAFQPDVKSPTETIVVLQQVPMIGVESSGSAKAPARKQLSVKPKRSSSGSKPEFRPPSPGVTQPNAATSRTNMSHTGSSDTSSKHQASRSSSQQASTRTKHASTAINTGLKPELLTKPKRSLTRSHSEDFNIEPGARILSGVSQRTLEEVKNLLIHVARKQPQRPLSADVIRDSGITNRGERIVSDPHSGAQIASDKDQEVAKSSATIRKLMHESRKIFLRMRRQLHLQDHFAELLEHQNKVLVKENEELWEYKTQQSIDFRARFAQKAAADHDTGKWKDHILRTIVARQKGEDLFDTGKYILKKIYEPNLTTGPRGPLGKCGLKGMPNFYKIHRGENEKAAARRQNSKTSCCFQPFDIVDMRNELRRSSKSWKEKSSSKSTSKEKRTTILPTDVLTDVTNRINRTSIHMPMPALASTSSKEGAGGLQQSDRFHNDLVVEQPTYRRQSAPMDLSNWTNEERYSMSGSQQLYDGDALTNQTNLYGGNRTYNNLAKTIKNENTNLMHAPNVRSGNLIYRRQQMWTRLSNWESLKHKSPTNCREPNMFPFRRAERARSNLSLSSGFSAPTSNHF